jgi:hypothetical protein
MVRHTVVEGGAPGDVEKIAGVNIGNYLVLNICRGPWFLMSELAPEAVLA